jgi:predicted porin
MQKKLLAVAVAGVLAAPAAAMAQSSVTISGVFKQQLDNYKINNPGPGRAGLNTSENRVSDGSSAIRFNVVEDLGGGMQAIAQLDQRFQPDQGNAGVSSNTQGNGNTFVGLRGSSWGTVSMGRFDLHYGKTPDDIPAKGGSLMASSISLMSYAGGGGTAIANATRTPNVLRYDSPNWSGFTFTVAGSSNPNAAGNPENDLTSTTKKGYAWTVNPQFASGPFGVGFSFWRSQNDAGTQSAQTNPPFNLPTAVTTRAEVTGQTLYGWYTAPFGLKVGFGIDRSSIDVTTIATGATVAASKRTAFSIPISWTTGPHTVYGTYTHAGDDSAIVGDQGAKMIALAYNYDLSKRTSVGITYARLTNNPNANYNFFTNTAVGFGSSNSSLAAGEDATLWALALRHAF